MKLAVINIKYRSSLWIVILLGFCFIGVTLNAQIGKLILSNEIGASGTQVCAEVSVEGFTDLDGFSMVINDAPTTNMTTFAQINNVNPLLNMVEVTDLGAFGVGFEWSIPPPSMLSLPDGAIIFEVCYDVIGNPGEIIELIFVPGLSIGTFFYKANGNDCILETMNGSITIPNAPPPLEITEDDISEDNCFEVDNGSVEITVTGGVPPYTFVWSNMTNNEDLIDVASGMYTVTISDSATNQNQEILSFTVPDATEAPIADAGTNDLITCVNDTINIGGTSTSLGDDFMYQWTSPGVTLVSGEVEPIAEIDQVGTYTLLVINTVNGCTAESMIDVNEDKDMPNVNAGENTAIPCDDNGLTLTAENDEGLMNISAVWSTIDGAIDNVIDDLSVSVLVSGTYNVILTNEDNGCTSEDAIIVSDPILPNIMSADDMPTLNCDNPTLDLTAITDMNISVAWETMGGQIDSGQDMNVSTVSSPGTYTATATDPNTNCMASFDIQVVGSIDEPTVNAGADVTFTCNDPIVSLTGSTDASTFEWTDANGNFIGNELSIDANRAGIYIFNAANEFGCQRSDEVMVVADTMAPIANAGMDLEVACIEDGISLDGTGSDMGTEFKYMWTTSNGTLVSGFTTLTPTVSTVGNYDLVVTNSQNGCSSLSNVQVNLQADLPLADAGIDFSICENSTILLGNLEDVITGEWTTTSAANIDNANSADITVSNLDAGSNAFIWTLSTDDCANYSRDTVFVIFESIPSAIEDIRSIPLNENTISFNVLDNDDTSNNDGVTTSFQTSDPNFMDLGDGSFTYTFPADTTNSFSFTYKICSELCPDLCDETEVNLTRIEPSLEPVELDGLPNVITPNGDGLNDALIFDIMLTNPQDFPNPELVVFNRWGDVVYRQQPYDNTWQGTNQTGGELPEGTYYFINRLNLANTDILTGDVTIIRD